LIAEKTAQRRGDMREALSLLDLTAEHAKELGLSKLNKKCVYASDYKLQRDETIEHIKGQTPPKKILLLLIYDYWINKHDYPTAVELRDKYNKFSEKNPVLESLKLRSIQTYLSELQTYEYIGRIGGAGLGRGKGSEPQKYKLLVDEDQFREKFYNDYVSGVM